MLPVDIRQQGSSNGLPSYTNDQSRSPYPLTSAAVSSHMPSSCSKGGNSANIYVPPPIYNRENRPSSNHRRQSNVVIPPPVGAQPVSHDVPRVRHSINYGQKSVVDAYLLAFVFGLVGAHHFYLKRYGWGILYFFTFGLLGCGYVIDLFRIPYLVRKCNRDHRPRNQRDPAEQHIEKKKDLSDAYVAWFPFGLIGFHHYYLENFHLGILFTLTFGIFGLGWLFDACRMPRLVNEANNKQKLIKYVQGRRKNLFVCYLFALPPLGWLGLHHFYLNRPFFGYAYTLSLGQLGIGWLVDLFRMPILLRRFNDELKLTRKRDTKTVDDCYVMWFPFGLVGFHHYYLGRLGWGLLYSFTFGIFGIGWLIDFVRIPCLVKETNRNRDEMEEQLVTDLRHDNVESPFFHSLPCDQNVYSDQNYNGYGSITSNQFDNNSNDIMRLPTNGVPYTPYNSPPFTPPDYTSNDNYTDKSDLMSKSPPPYTQ